MKKNIKVLGTAIILILIQTSLFFSCNENHPKSGFVKFRADKYDNSAPAEITFIDETDAYVIYKEWKFEGGDPKYVLNENCPRIFYKYPGEYDVTLISSIYLEKDSMIISDTLTKRQYIKLQD